LCVSLLNVFACLARACVHACARERRHAHMHTHARAHVSTSESGSVAVVMVYNATVRIDATPAASQQVEENIGPGHASLQDSCLAETISPLVTVTIGNSWPRILQQKNTPNAQPTAGSNQSASNSSQQKQRNAAATAGAAAMPEAGTKCRDRGGGMS